MQHGTHDDQLAALTLYGTVAVAMGLSWLVMFTYLDRRRDLLHSDVAAGFFRAERRRAAPGILGPIIAIAIGTVAPAAALIAVLFLPIFYGLTTEGWGPRRRTTM
ncbi:MAG: hypothetical protein NVSMB65_10580 [Chloroflexota bacterium]